LSGFSGGWLQFGNGSFTLEGNALTLSGGITNSSGDNTFNLAVTLSGAQTFEVDASSLTFNGAITNNGGLTISGPGNVTWTMSLANGLKGAGNLVMNGSGILTANGGFSNPGVAYGWTGNTIVNAGTFVNNVSSWSANSAVGASLTVNPGATFENDSVHF